MPEEAKANGVPGQDPSPHEKKPQGALSYLLSVPLSPARCLETKVLHTRAA